MTTPADPSATELEQLSATDALEPIAQEIIIRVLTSPPFIPSRSLINIRDAGAVPGSQLPKGRFYRCGTLDLAAKDPEALEWISANVTRIFDLRKANERESSPDPHIAGVENIWLDGDGEYPSLVLGDFDDDGGRPAWRAQYLGITSAYRPTIRALLEHVRDRPTEPVLFHCTAGRDRTGVMAGLLQHLAGTASGPTCLDYMLSRIGTEPAREKLIHFALSTAGTTDPQEPSFRNLISLRPEFWNGFLEGLEEEYGGWDGYVTKGLGFSEQDLAKIKGNLRSG
ncbi:hypothetical protein HIM_01117 [Hirsutella minnesotensis 3608]|nr:hypothetical protein HIM_01117 [Hirsutella minnesotensis 3608]